MSDVKLSVVSPVYRAEKIVPELVKQIEQHAGAITFSYEIILVEDSSPDNSWKAIMDEAKKNDKVKGIRLSRNFGQHAAIIAGISHAKGEWIIVMDCDLQDDPAEISSLYNKAIQGHDVVLAKREHRQDNFFKKTVSRFFYKVFEYLTDTKQTPSIANYGIYNRKVIDAVLQIDDYVKFFPAMVRWVGFDVATVDVKHQQRYEGSSTYNMSRLIRLAVNVILSFSTKPLILLIKFGLLISFCAVVFALYYLYLLRIGEIKVMGYTSIISSIWLLSGLIIASIGFVGLYIGRIFDQTKNRPVFIVNQRVNL
jgi:glycosyltransferase involved in cell wall biosynthesis